MGVSISIAEAEELATLGTGAAYRVWHAGHPRPLAERAGLFFHNLVLDAVLEPAVYKLGDDASFGFWFAVYKRFNMLVD